MNNFLRYDGPVAEANRTKQVMDYIGLVATVGQVIREAKSIPSGVLYAQVMGSLDLRTYNNIIGILKRTKMVQEKSYLLTWIGPEPVVEKEYVAPIKPTIRWFKNPNPEEE